VGGSHFGPPEFVIIGRGDGGKLRVAHDRFPPSLL
jgi:hypothetical protein